MEGYTLRGSKLPALVLRIEQRRPRPANQEAAVSMVAARVPPPVRDAVRQHMLGLALPEWLPPYSALLTDGEGVLWVMLSAPGDGVKALRALTSEGGGRWWPTCGCRWSLGCTRSGLDPTDDNIANNLAFPIMSLGYGALQRNDLPGALREYERAAHLMPTNQLMQQELAQLRAVSAAPQLFDSAPQADTAKRR